MNDKAVPTEHKTDTHLTTDYESNLVKHAKREFKAAGWLDKKEPMQEAIMDGMIELLTVFSNQEHSGFSANYAANLFNQLVRFEPITPLTGADDEWQPCGSGEKGVFQNIRASHVFKENGEAYDIRGIIFRDSKGVTFTSKESHIPVTFPYTPKPIIKDVP